MSAPPLTDARPSTQAPEEPPARRRLLRRSVPVGVLLVALALFPAYRYGVGLDGLSYLSVAEAYARGDWAAALNPYWSPLYSWVHVPVLVAGIAPLDAATIVTAFVAAAAVAAVHRLLRATGTSEQSAWMVSLALSPLVLSWAHYGVFADLLLAALLTAALADLVDPRFARGGRIAARAGLLLGLAYLAKLYALPFAAVVVPLAVLLHVLAGRRRPAGVARAALVAVGAFLLVAAPWVGVLSAAEGRFTVGTAGSHNLLLVSPDSKGNPIFYAGLLPPARARAYSAWEDPSAMPVEASGWGGGSERSAADTVLRNVRRNAAAGWEALTDQGAALLAVGAVGALWWLGGDRRAPVGVLGAAGALAVYIGGYLFTWVEPRYAWFPLLLLAVPTGVLLDRITRSRAGRGGALAAALLLTLVLLPPATQELVLKWSSGRSLDAIVTSVAEQGLVEPGMHVASADNWQRSAILCFRLDCTYLGIPAAEDPDERDAELVEHGVDRYLLWSDAAAEPEGLQPVGTTPDPEDAVAVYAAPRAGSQGVAGGGRE